MEGGPALCYSCVENMLAITVGDILFRLTIDEVRARAAQRKARREEAVASTDSINTITTEGDCNDRLE